MGVARDTCWRVGAGSVTDNNGFPWSGGVRGGHQWYEQLLPVGSKQEEIPPGTPQHRSVLIE